MAYIHILRKFEITILEMLQTILAYSLPLRSHLPQFITSVIGTLRFEALHARQARIALAAREATLLHDGGGHYNPFRRPSVIHSGQAIPAYIIPDIVERPLSPIVDVPDTVEDVADMIFDMEM